MTIRIVRLGSPRALDEGLRLGTVRRPPRGVRREDHARLDYYDLWLPLLAPSAALLAESRKDGDFVRAWPRFERRYLAEMRESAPAQLLDLLALLSRSTDFSVGCYCADESICHRSLLARLLRERGAVFAAPPDPGGQAS
jgi:uncharacterized protein YeaO (DUF488 family)